MSDIDPTAAPDGATPALAAGPSHAMRVTTSIVESSAGNPDPRLVYRRSDFPRGYLLVLARCGTPRVEKVAASMARVAAVFDAFDPDSRPEAALRVAFDKAYDHLSPDPELSGTLAADLTAAYFDLQAENLHVVSAGNWHSLMVRDGCELIVSRTSRPEPGDRSRPMLTFELQVGDRLLFASKELGALGDAAITECLSEHSPQKAAYNLIQRPLYDETVSGRDSCFVVVAVVLRDEEIDESRWPEPAPERR